MYKYRYAFMPSIYSRAIKYMYVCVHYKNTFDINTSYLSLYEEGPYTCRIKGGLDSGIKTKTSKIAL